MDALKEICAYLPAETGQALLRLGQEKAIVNVRLRAGQRLCAQWMGGDTAIGEPLAPRALEERVSSMLDHSLYAWEDELGAGYFTLPGGSRAGVTGRFAHEGGRVRLTAIGSVCLRVARAVPGCAGEVVRRMTEGGRARSTLLLAPPGAGKTTLLRDAARLMSLSGRNVAISDERGEIAACAGGVPAFDVGARTDVLYGLNKALAIPRLVRAMAPDVLITDEVGDARDVRALCEAARMGVAVLASAHAADVEDALRRPQLRALMMNGGFTRALALRAPGRVAGVWVHAGGWVKSDGDDNPRFAEETRKRREREDGHGFSMDCGAGDDGV